MSEIILALKHNKPVILLHRDLPEELKKYEKSQKLTSVITPQEAVNQTAAILERSHE